MIEYNLSADSDAFDSNDYHASLHEGVPDTNKVSRLNPPSTALLSPSEWHLDSTGYYPYLLISSPNRESDLEWVKQICELVEQNTIVRCSSVIGKSNRQAHNGHRYQFYIRLDDVYPEEQSVKELNTLWPPLQSDTSDETAKRTDNEKLEAKLELARQYYCQHIAKIRILEERILLDMNSSQRALSRKDDDIAELVDQLKEVDVHVTTIEQQLKRSRNKLRELKGSHQQTSQSEKINKREIQELEESHHALLKERDHNKGTISKLRLKQKADQQAFENLLQEAHQKFTIEQEKLVQLQSPRKKQPPIKQTANSVVDQMLGSRIELIGGSHSVLDHEMQDATKHKVNLYICRILDGEQNKIVDLKKVRGAQHWYEGDVGKDFRIYWRNKGSDYQVLIGAKKNQSADINLLKRNDK